MPGRVLLIEDDPETSGALEAVLTHEGWEIKTVADGIRAIRMVYEWLPDLMLLDLMLPGMDGYQICRLIKSDPNLRDLPVVILTARTLPEERRYGFEIGADEYVTKPFDIHDLITRMEDALTRTDGRLKDREIVDPFADKNDLAAATSIILRVNQLLDEKLMELSHARAKQKETEKQLKENQQQLVQAAKLLSLGVLVAGIAHELSQPLTVIRGFAQWIRKRISSTDRYYEELGMIEEGTTRMMKIIDHLRAFSGESEHVDVPIPVNQILENALLLTTERLKTHDIQIVVDYAESFPCVIGDANQLEQAFLSLISNAQDAMEKTGGGTLRIATRAMSDRTHPESSGYAEISISDTGQGIPDEILDRIFDPFFTTKEVGKGMGLGLSACYGIVREHGGEIQVNSQRGHGATFTVLLPAISLSEHLVP